VTGIPENPLTQNDRKRCQKAVSTFEYLPSLITNSELECASHRQVIDWIAIARKGASVMALSNYILALLPLAIPGWYLLDQLDDPIPVFGRWFRMLISSTPDENSPTVPPVGSQLLAYVVVALFGFVVTNHLVPNIKVNINMSARESIV
jgi:lipid-A-disaccharide synthase-like uncharacterized protein